MAWGALGIVLAGAFAAWALGVRERATIVTVKPSETYQVMTGWEVTARAWETDKVANRFDGSWLDFRDEIIAVLADEAGINRIRLEVHSGSENPVDYWARFMKGEITYKEMWAHIYEKINDNADPPVAESRRLPVLAYRLPGRELSAAAAATAGGARRAALHQSLLRRFPQATRPETSPMHEIRTNMPS